MNRSAEEMKALCAKHLDAFVAEFGTPPSCDAFDQLKALTTLVRELVVGMSGMTDFETVMEYVGMALQDAAQSVGHRVELVKAHGGIQ